MEERVDQLEKKKLEDVDSWIKRMILIEMNFHSSALSVLTKAFGEISQADISSN